MNDEPRSMPPADGIGPSGGQDPAGAPPEDEALAALERLQSLGGGPPSGAGPEPSAPPPRQRQATSARAPSAGRRPRSRPRAAAAGSPSRTAVRIVAPVAFLVAVIVLVSLLFQSGVVGGGDESRGPAPTPKPTKTKKATEKPSAPATTGTKIYVVKSGDTLSAIALKFDTTVSELEDLNPETSSTLVVGAKLRVPAPAP